MSGKKSLASPALTLLSGIGMLTTLTKAACDWECGRINREPFLNPIAHDIFMNYSAKPIHQNGLKRPRLHCL
jgi:hypothetical protein